AEFLAPTTATSPCRRAPPVTRITSTPTDPSEPLVTVAATRPCCPPIGAPCGTPHPPPPTGAPYGGPNPNRGALLRLQALQGRPAQGQPPHRGALWGAEPQQGRPAQAPGFTGAPCSGATAPQG